MCEDCTFTSKENVQLAGYKFFSSENGATFSEACNKAKAVVIIAHGMGGGGFNSYMNAAAWFAKYLKEHFDKKQANEVDEELFERIDGFYTKCCQR